MKKWFKKNWQVLAIVILIVYILVQNINVMPLGNDYESYAMPKMAMSRGAEVMDIAAYSNTEYSGQSADLMYEDEERKIRKNGNVNIEVEKNTAVKQADQAEQYIKSIQGYIQNRNEYRSTINDVDYIDVSLEVKVPMESFDAAMAQLRNMGKVSSFNVNQNDITTQYYDTKAYLESYQKEKTKIEQLLDKAEKIEDIIKIEEKLMDIQRRIDDHQRRLTNMDRETDYSRIYLRIEEKKDYSEAKKYFTPLVELVEEFAKSLNGLIVFMFKALAWLIPIGIVYLIYLGGRKLVKK